MIIAQYAALKEIGKTTIPSRTNAEPTTGISV